MRASSFAGSSVLILAGLLSANTTYANNYDQLVMQARAGEHGPVLQWFQQQPDLTTRQQLDWLLISSWDEQDQLVVDIYRQYQNNLQNHTEAREVYARSLRNLQQWAAAEAEYISLVASHPGRDDLRHALIMTQADAGKLAAAHETSALWVKQAADNPIAHLARGYVFRRDGEHYAALRHYDFARYLTDQNPDIRREYLLALQQAGLSSIALQRTEDLDLLSAAELRGLQADQVAEWVSLSTLSTRRQTDRYRLADRALNRADELLNEWAGDPDTLSDRNRVRIDRLGALHTRQHMQQLITDAEALQAESVELPAYAQRWYAGALLHMREPESAAAIYQRLIARTTSRDDSWLADHRSLYFALIESEELTEADQIASMLAIEQPLYLNVPGTEAQVPNEAWTNAQILLGNTHRSLDRLPEAQEHFSSLSDAAPGNTDLRLGRASIYQVRGWPRRAEGELKFAESNAPLSSAVVAAQADNHFALREWRNAEELTAYQVNEFPESLSSHRLNQRQQRHNMRELQINAWRSIANGGEAQGSGDYGVETLLYSSPINHDWRVFTGAGYATGSFQEGRGYLRWQRLGADWRVRDHWVTADISNNNYGHGNQVGFTLAVSHDLDDIWQVGWQLDWNSRNIPLRALRSDIGGDRQSAFLRWRANERREWRFTGSRLDYDDGNTQLGLALSGRERIHTQPRWHLDLNLDLSASENSQPGEGPYFSPDQDISLLPSLSLNHIIFRHYDLRWSQRLQAGAGAYQQRDIGAHAIALLAYGQRLQLTPEFETGFNLSLTSRPYDGQREQGVRLDVDLNWRF